MPVCSLKPSEVPKSLNPKWACFKGHGFPGGLSAVDGQIQTPYVIGRYKQEDRMIGPSDYCGSSSGSAGYLNRENTPFTHLQIV
ncbi:uncharacterized protein N7483_000838 [Penicillium malachiteum]|uniref:uncharacterized protein n=1 Tax=Penicillium malachiteum TaxID=1324776 RepID=UPI0025497BC9|nr:uncharacterized protein N7483_000838 [Penicillium malachiteum]KAJ5735713.1 hypothetical protein N7483_000838 [Penicillium malachiteum]